jgi:hypothetical protein
MLYKNPLVTFLSLVSVVALTFFATLAFTQTRADQPASQPSAPALAPVMADADTIAPVPPFRPDPAAQDSAAALSPTLSYYFISGNTFSADLGSGFYARQNNGCVNQMPLSWGMSAPVHLPQASQVVSITLYTYNTVITTTYSTAYFLINDGQGSYLATFIASSLPGIADYQQKDSNINNPTTIDNQNESYQIQWRTWGSSPSPYLSLCGVRVAYYAPAALTFLPLSSNP